MPRVLVVDDQADVRAMISILLRINRYEIVEAATAAAGLKAFENGSFDLAIVDIFLQDTDGSDLIATMRERAPDLPVVAISGITALDFLTKSPGLSDVVCLQKPFRPPDLIAAIEAARGSCARPAPWRGCNPASKPSGPRCLRRTYAGFAVGCHFMVDD